MKLLAISLFFGALQAQTASLSLTGPAAVASGQPVTITINLASGGGPAGIQWDMTGLPAGGAFASLVNGKSSQCTATRCVLAGTNASAIPDGPIATVKYTQPASPAPFALVSTLAASPAGSGITITAPPSFTVPVPSNCDLNQDGKVDATDIGIVTQQTLVSTTGSPTILDIVRVIIAANGGACLR